MMTVTMTCPECGSGIHIYPNAKASKAQCDVCQKVVDVHFTKEHEAGILKECPNCSRKDFYQQRDFNRKIGVMLFVVAAIASIWTYGLSFVVLYAFDFLLFKRLSSVAICYKCDTIFRNVTNLKEIHGFDHEMNDRIKYADHDFQGKPLEH